MSWLLDTDVMCLGLQSLQRAPVEPPFELVNGRGLNSDAIHAQREFFACFSQRITVSSVPYRISLPAGGILLLDPRDDVRALFGETGATRRLCGVGVRCVLVSIRVAKNRTLAHTVDANGWSASKSSSKVIVTF